MLKRIRIEADGTPLYVQIKRQVMACVADGILRPGEQLATMREVALALTVNLATVQKAYGELEDEGFIVTQRGRGTFVAEFPTLASPDVALERTDRLARQTAAIAMTQGLEPLAVGKRIVEISEEAAHSAPGTQGKK